MAVFNNRELASEEFNYEGKLIPRDRISETLVDIIIKQARRFICLIAPFWTRKAVKEMDFANATELTRVVTTHELI